MKRTLGSVQRRRTNRVRIWEEMCHGTKNELPARIRAREGVLEHEWRRLTCRSGVRAPNPRSTRFLIAQIPPTIHLNEHDHSRCKHDSDNDRLRFIEVHHGATLSTLRHPKHVFQRWESGSLERAFVLILVLVRISVVRMSRLG